MYIRLAVVLVFAACTIKPPDGDGDSGTSSAETGGAEATSAPGTSPTTSAGGEATTAPGTATIPDGPTTESSATESFGSTSGSASQFGSEGGSVSGDPDGGGLPGACADACMHLQTCEPGSVPPFAECVSGCVDGFEDPPECAAATAAQWSCIAALPCEEALKFVDGGEPTMCLAEVAAVEDACLGIECGGEIGGDMVTCELMQECGDGEQNYSCDSETCTCTQDGVEAAQCPSDGFCSLGFDEQRAAITACCGWVWGP